MIKEDNKYQFLGTVPDTLIVISEITLTITNIMEVKRCVIRSNIRCECD